MRVLLSNLLAVLGAGLFAFGVWLMYAPAGYCVAGALIVAAVVWEQRS